MLGCSTLPQNQISLIEALDTPDVLTFPFSKDDNGLILLDDVLVGDQKLRLLLDTGATRSAIFERNMKALDLADAPRRTVNVYGLAGKAERDLITVPVVTLGQTKFLNLDFVVLPDRAKASVFRQGDVKMDGIMGMDILGDYSLYVSRHNATITFIPKETDVRLPRSLLKVELVTNPFVEEDRGLHFFQTEILGENVTTLLDTGAEINVMNWNDVKSRDLRKWYKRTRETWEVAGAVGTFDPKLRIRMDSLGSGPVTWYNKDFIVMDIPSLEILGIGEDSFMVVGFNLLNHEEVFIDFERNVLALKARRGTNPTPILR
jgi:predicted aspartyl protease